MLQCLQMHFAILNPLPKMVLVSEWVGKVGWPHAGLGDGPNAKSPASHHVVVIYASWLQPKVCRNAQAAI